MHRPEGHSTPARQKSDFFGIRGHSASGKSVLFDLYKSLGVTCAPTLTHGLDFIMRMNTQLSEQARSAGLGTWPTFGPKLSSHT